MANGITAAEAAARAALLDVRSYEIVLDLTADPDQARSSTVITFGCREPGQATFADLTVPRVDRLTVNGDDVDSASVLAAGRLMLPALAASNTLAVQADAAYSPAGGLAQFTDQGDGERYLLANCFPTSAPAVFCCFDQPDVRADMTLTVKAPAGWECISNGAVTERPPAGQPGWWRFATVPAMKSYELTLCAGPYVTVETSPAAAAASTPDAAEPRSNSDQVSLTIRCRKSLAGSVSLARLVDVIRRTLRFYEQLLGVQCPYDRLEVIFAPELGPMAMQLPAVMYVSETLLARIADPGDDHAVTVIAHELAHLWFGCLVEGRWWDDLWLAEAMASYLSYLACEEALGISSAWTQFAMQGQVGAYRADSLPSTQPVASPVDTAADAITRPSAVTYNKGTSVIRQLAALIGDDALRAGLRDYLTRYGWSTATLADLIGCWSRASGRDLTGWAQQWLREPGPSLLRPELTLAPDGTIQSLVIRQSAKPGDPTLQAGTGAPLRTHRLAIGLYGRERGRLDRRRRIIADVSGERTEITELTGIALPAALILNDGDLTFARTRFDDRSLRALADCALDVGDPLTEAVCWTAAWDMTTAAELTAAEFVDLVARGISRERPVTGLAELLGFALTAANYYAAPAQRSGLLQRLAAAALDGSLRASNGSQARHALRLGFAASADSADQLAVLRSLLDVAPAADLEPGHGLELRGRILATLSAHGLASDDELDMLAAADPVSGERQRATCRALRPDLAAKQTAWGAALAGDQPIRLAMAHAQGIWAPGQDHLLTGFRDRFFTDALPALARADHRTAQRLARLLYPAILADSRTIAATNEALLDPALGDALRLVLVEQRAILQQVMAARAVPLLTVT